MDFDEYVVARRRRLLEHAVGLGLDGPQAAELVDRVLAEQRRRIGRAEDPDPTTYSALDRAARGPSRHRRRTAVGAVALVTLLVGVVVWRSTAASEQVSVPSTFSFDATDAAATLQRRGLEVGLSTTLSCEPHGLVVSSAPRAGTRVDIGSAVVLKAAMTTSGQCADVAGRAEAWAFLRFTRGGPPPLFDDTVYVVHDGGEPAVLPAAAATDPARWSSIQDVADVASRPARTLSGQPRLVVVEGTPPAEQCGTPRPAGAGTRTTLRLQLVEAEDPEHQQDDQTCPFTVDLYRSRDGRIDAVVVYSGGASSTTSTSKPSELSR